MVYNLPLVCFLLNPITGEEYTEPRNDMDKTTIDSCKGAIELLKQKDILDKIRDEIENDWQLKQFPCSPFSCGLRQAIEIIDKYRAESEV